MCGRYSLFVEEDLKELAQILDMLERRCPGSRKAMKSGEICPTDTAPLLVSKQERIVPVLSEWGFPSFQKNRVIINARAETAGEKQLFRDSLSARRCVIPSTGFYEWRHSGQKEKYLFNLPETKMLYMAGLWNVFEGKRRYVILTTAANYSMREIHDRMPVVLQSDEVRNWLTKPEYALAVLKKTPPLLCKEAVS